jgi:hypothetical protein
VWVISEATDEEARCAFKAKWEYSIKRDTPGKLPTVERYTMCGKHGTAKNRAKAEFLGYIVREITYEA